MSRTPFIAGNWKMHKTIAEAEEFIQALLPKVSTAWVRPPGYYTAHCSHADGASVLAVGAHAGARVFKASPTPQWGLHLGDISLALGNLTDLVARQTTAYRDRRG